MITPRKVHLVQEKVGTEHMLLLCCNMQVCFDIIQVGHDTTHNTVNHYTIYVSYNTVIIPHVSHNTVSHYTTYFSHNTAIIQHVSVIIPHMLAIIQHMLVITHSLCNMLVI